MNLLSSSGSGNITPLSRPLRRCKPRYRKDLSKARDRLVSPSLSTRGTNGARTWSPFSLCNASVNRWPRRRQDRVCATLQPLLHSTPAVPSSFPCGHGHRLTTRRRLVFQPIVSTTSPTLCLSFLQAGGKSAEWDPGYHEAAVGRRYECPAPVGRDRVTCKEAIRGTCGGNFHQTLSPTAAAILHAARPWPANPPIHMVQTWILLHDHRRGHPAAAYSRPTRPDAASGEQSKDRDLPPAPSSPMPP